jgi:hypothetical protein
VPLAEVRLDMVEEMATKRWPSEASPEAIVAWRMVEAMKRAM